MPGSALIAAGSLGSAGIGAYSANRAAATQARGAQQARADQMPWMNAGRGAVTSLAQLYGIDPNTGALTGQPFPEGSLDAFRRSPDYQFASDEGRRQVEFSNSARGWRNSGNNQRDLMSFGQGLATQQFGNYRGALERLAQMGQGSAGAAGQAGMQAHAATASGWTGGANAVTGALGNYGNYLMLSNLMGRQNGGTLSAYPPITTGAAAPWSPTNTGGFSSVLPGGMGNAPY